MYNSYNNYNSWETEEERRRKQMYQGLGQIPYNQNQNMMQIPYQQGSTFNPREQVEQAWDKSIAEQSAKDAIRQPIIDAAKGMNTHDAIDYFMKLQENKSTAPADSELTVAQPAMPSAAANIQSPLQSQTATASVHNSFPLGFAKMGVPEYEESFQRNRDRLCSEIFEGNRKYAYLDNANPPRATIGCGINIDSVNGIQLQNRATGQNFSREEQQRELQKLRDSHINNARARYYEDKSNIGISDAENERQMRNKYADAYKNLNKKFPKFSSFTPERQDALLDMNYALGSGKFNKFVLMKEAIDKNKWDEAAFQSHRAGIDERRNDWTAKQLDPEWEKHKYLWCK